MEVTMTTNFLYEADHATTTTVKDAVNAHCKKFNIPCAYGFGGLSANTPKYYGHVPYIVVNGDAVKIPGFGWRKNKKLARLLNEQSPLYKINCQ